MVCEIYLNKPIKMYKNSIKKGEKKSNEKTNINEISSWAEIYQTDLVPTFTEPEVL